MAEKFFKSRGCPPRDGCGHHVVGCGSWKKIVIVNRVYQTNSMLNNTMHRKIYAIAVNLIHTFYHVTFTIVHHVIPLFVFVHGVVRIVLVTMATSFDPTVIA